MSASTQTVLSTLDETQTNSNPVRGSNKKRKRKQPSIAPSTITKRPKKETLQEVRDERNALREENQILRESLAQFQQQLNRMSVEIQELAQWVNQSSTTRAQPPEAELNNSSALIATPSDDAFLDDLLTFMEREDTDNHQDEEDFGELSSTVSI